MKRLLLLLFLNLFQIINAFASTFNLSITYPNERTVFQRNVSDKADFYFSAQYTINNSTIYTAEYRLQPLNLSDGTINGSPTAWTNIAFNNTVGSVRTLIGNVNGLSKGWYQLRIRILNNGVQQELRTRKFGIGDIFLIAGQSNSQGFEGFDLNNASQDRTIISYYRDGYSTLPDAVNICPFYVRSESNGSVPTRAGTRRQTLTDFNKLQQSGNRIFPNGIDSWCYAVLGKDIQAITDAPIAFFNAGASGSDVENWIESIPQNPVTKGTTHFRFAIPFSQNDLFGNYPTTPYVPLRNTLQMFCSVMGIRAVMWHQGETDAELKRPDIAPTETFDYYKIALDSLISQSRRDFKDANNNNQTSLSWFVSKVAFWRSYYNNPNPGWNDQITANLIPKQVAVANTNRLGANTDGIGMFSHSGFPNDTTRAAQIDGFNVHFSNYGLKILADKWLASQPWTGNPISGKPLLPITVTPSGLQNDYNLTAPAGYASYIWVVTGDLMTNYIGNQRTLSDVRLFGSNQIVMCYVSKSSDPNEMNFFACQPFAIGSFSPSIYPDFLTFDSPFRDFLVTPSPIDQKAYNVINATNAVKNSGTTVNYQAGKAIILENGFKAENGTTFKAEIITLNNPLPLNWSSANIGSGSGTSTVSSETLSITGNGALGGTSDNIHYYNAYTTGDVNIIARIDGMSSTTGQQAGIMIRNSLSSNDVFYEFVIDGNGSVAKIKRKNASDNASLVGNAVCPTSGSWIRIDKIGNTIECYFKPNDASNWIPVIGWDDHSDNNFSGSFTVGIVAYNGASAIFSNISVNGVTVN